MSHVATARKTSIPESSWTGLYGASWSFTATTTSVAHSLSLPTSQLHRRLGCGNKYSMVVLMVLVVLAGDTNTV